MFLSGNEVEAKASAMPACPACSCTRGHRLVKFPRVFSCYSCEGVVGDAGYLGDSYGLVSPHWADREVPAALTRYFDLVALGSTGEVRRHGWFDPRSRRVTQVG
jgi:hypothetical protein